MNDPKRPIHADEREVQPDDVSEDLHVDERIQEVPPPPQKPPEGDPEDQSA